MWTLLPIDQDFALRLLKAAQASTFRPAGVAGSARIQSVLRSDSIKWLEVPESQGERQALDFLATVQKELQQYFRIHIGKVECHFSEYQPGQFYVRHSDVSAKSSDGTSRIFSFVIYLNPDWGDADGGELRGYEGEKTIFEIAPRLGTMIIFRSDIEHEVLPARKNRYALTGWFRK